MVLDDLLNLALELRSDGTLCDLLQECRLSRRQVRAELSLPPGDLVDGDGVKLAKN